MDIETLRAYCLSKKGVIEAMPFDNCVLVFKVGGKIFALANICNFSSVNLKYPTDLIGELRANNTAVTPGFHMSKKHWNTIVLAQTNWEQMMEWIDISYDLIFSGLSKKTQMGLQTD